MTKIKNSATESNYFNFNDLNSKDSSINYSYFDGWNGLEIFKFKLIKNDILTKSFINFKIKNTEIKETIFVTTEGKLEVTLDDKKEILKEYDAVNFFYEPTEYQIKALENSTMYLVSAKAKQDENKDPFFFNFKEDVRAKDLWGGQCISRPYEGGEITLVLFDLKAGFKFEDKGHKNEQITWLIKGEMSFYANNKHEKLFLDKGVDIGPNHLHGGVSNGAVGFDAFFPKREEVKYKKNI